MVFESQVGETFLLGASTWRIEEITHDRVMVSPAPGEPGKMPFWKGDSAGRPRELGLRNRAARARARARCRRLPRSIACERSHDLDRTAGENLLQYLADQTARRRAPSPTTARSSSSGRRDELGDWRVCVLSPLGGRVLIPWCLAVVARLRAELGLDVETMWSDDGFVVRMPESETPPDARLFVPSPDEVEDLVVAAARRERALRGAFSRSGRPRAAAAAAARRDSAPRCGSSASAPPTCWRSRRATARSPIVLETYRECLRDVFDMPALVDTLSADRSRRAIRVVTVDTQTPSPFAASLLFTYVASFLYDGDAPLAERRAQALSVDHAQLRELLGDAELRELLDPDVLETLERQLQWLDDDRRARSVDGLHDLLLRVGDLTRERARGVAGARPR